MKMTWNDFIISLENKNICFLGCLYKNIDEAKNILDQEIDNITINYNRILCSSNSKDLKFYIKENGKIKESYLSKYGNIYFYKECYFITQDNYVLIYKISNDAFVSFENDIKIQEDKKKKSVL